jgi:hypothetical protein
MHRKNLLFSSTRTLLVAAGLSVSIWGCQRETTVAPATGSESVGGGANAEKATTADMQDVAMMVAGALNDVEVRRAIKAEALKQFDGDYDILYSRFAGFAFPNGEKFSDKLAKSFALANGRTTGEAAAKLKHISAILPLLNLSVPVNIDKWDVESSRPLVVFRPVDFSEKTTKTVKAIDGKGNMVTLNTDVAPAEPVIVVGLNERVDDKGEVKTGFLPVETAAKNGRVSKSNYEEYDRWENYWEYLYQVHYAQESTLDASESWIQGGPEIRLQVKAIANNNTMYGETFNLKRDQVRSGRWVTLNARMFVWNTASIGRYMLYYFVEDDGGTETTSTIGNTQGGVNYSVSVKKKQEDYLLIEQLVDFQTKMPTLYGWGFQFSTVQW